MTPDLTAGGFDSSQVFNLQQAERERERRGDWVERERKQEDLIIETGDRRDFSKLGNIFTQTGRGGRPGVILVDFFTGTRSD